MNHDISDSESEYNPDSKESIDTSDLDSDDVRAKRRKIS